MSGWDVIVGLWLAINALTLIGTLRSIVIDWRDLQAVEAEAAAGNQPVATVILAQRDLIQDTFVALMAIMFIVAGVAAGIMEHSTRGHSPLLTIAYVLAFLAAVVLLNLKQAQKAISRRRVRRLYAAHPWDQ